MGYEFSWGCVVFAICLDIGVDGWIGDRDGTNDRPTRNDIGRLHCGLFRPFVDGADCMDSTSKRFSVGGFIGLFRHVWLGICKSRESSCPLGASFDASYGTMHRLLFSN